MDFQLSFIIPPSPIRITHQDPVLLTGSCFTEHIGNRMLAGKFPAKVNPHGILFNPLSIAEGLEAAVQLKKYTESDLFSLNGIWNSWAFHSSYSGTSKDAVLKGMNDSIRDTHHLLSRAKVLVVTFGSALQYFLFPEAAGMQAGGPLRGVANCHKAPAKWFEKRLLSIREMRERWEQTTAILKAMNPGLDIIFTVSPVRHSRDGLITNNRSKARLLELVHDLTETKDYCSYFPAYEWVIDVLRDYRFFETDMIHPNNQAAQYVWEQFVGTYMTTDTRHLLERIREITAAAAHRERFPGTEASRQFKAAILRKTEQLRQQYPWLDLEKEAHFFSVL